MNRLPRLPLASMAALAAAATLTALPAAAADRVRLVVNGSYHLAKPGFDETRTFVEFGENATVKSTYDTKAAFGPDAAVQVRLFKRLHFLAGYATATRSEDGAFDAKLPHPLYLNQPRSLTGTFSGDYKESSIDLDLALGARRGQWDWAVFAGASLFQAEVALLQRVVYDQSYPYDEVTFAQAQTKKVKESPTGFNVGGRLDRRFGKSFGAGLQAAYRTAKVKARSGSDATEASIDAGGFRIGAGLRFYF